MAERRNRRNPRAVSPHALFSLHKYFLRSIRMLRHFDDTLKRISDYERNSSDHRREEFNAQMYFDYWLAALNVVVEGYEKLGLHDDYVEILINSPIRSTLLKYRSGIYHFREKYWDDDIILLIRDKEAMEWSQKLNTMLGKYLLREIDILIRESDSGSAKS